MSTEACKHRDTHSSFNKLARGSCLKNFAGLGYGHLNERSDHDNAVHHEDPVTVADDVDVRTDSRGDGHEKPRPI